MTFYPAVVQYTFVVAIMATLFLFQVRGGVIRAAKEIGDSEQTQSRSKNTGEQSSGRKEFCGVTQDPNQAGATNSDNKQPPSRWSLSWSDVRLLRRRHKHNDRIDAQSNVADSDISDSHSTPTRRSLLKQQLRFGEHTELFHLSRTKRLLLYLAFILVMGPGIGEYIAGMGIKACGSEMPGGILTLEYDSKCEPIPYGTLEMVSLQLLAVVALAAVPDWIAMRDIMRGIRSSRRDDSDDTMRRHLHPRVRAGTVPGVNSHPQPVCHLGKLSGGLYNMVYYTRISCITRMSAAVFWVVVAFAQDDTLTCVFCSSVPFFVFLIRMCTMHSVCGGESMREVFWALLGGFCITRRKGLSGAIQKRDTKNLHQKSNTNNLQNGKPSNSIPCENNNIRTDSPIRYFLTLLFANKEFAQKWIGGQVINFLGVVAASATFFIGAESQSLEVQQVWIVLLFILWTEYFLACSVRHDQILQLYVMKDRQRQVEGLLIGSDRNHGKAIGLGSKKGEVGEQSEQESVKEKGSPALHLVLTKIEEHNMAMLNYRDCQVGCFNLVLGTIPTLLFTQYVSRSLQQNGDDSGEARRLNSDISGTTNTDITDTANTGITDARGISSSQSSDSTSSQTYIQFAFFAAGLLALYQVWTNGLVARRARENSEMKKKELQTVMKDNIGIDLEDVDEEMEAQRVCGFGEVTEVVEGMKEVEEEDHSDSENSGADDSDSAISARRGASEIDGNNNSNNHNDNGNAVSYFGDNHNVIVSDIAEGNCADAKKSSRRDIIPEHQKKHDANDDLAFLIKHKMPRKVAQDIGHGFVSVLESQGRFVKGMKGNASAHEGESDGADCCDISGQLELRVEEIEEDGVGDTNSTRVNGGTTAATTMIAPLPNSNTLVNHTLLGDVNDQTSNSHMVPKTAKITSRKPGKGSVTLTLAELLSDSTLVDQIRSAAQSATDEDLESALDLSILESLCTDFRRFGQLRLEIHHSCFVDDKIHHGNGGMNATSIVEELLSLAGQGWYIRVFLDSLPEDLQRAWGGVEVMRR